MGISQNNVHCAVDFGGTCPGDLPAVCRGNDDTSATWFGCRSIYAGKGMCVISLSWSLLLNNITAYERVFMSHETCVSSALCDIKAAGTLHPDKNVAWKTLNDRLMRQKSKKPSFMPHDRLKLQFSCDKTSVNRVLRKGFGLYCRMNGVKSDFYATWEFICQVQGRRHINRVKKPPEYYNPGAFILCSFMYKKH